MSPRGQHIGPFARRKVVNLLGPRQASDGIRVRPRGSLSSGAKGRNNMENYPTNSNNRNNEPNGDCSFIHGLILRAVD